MTIFEASSDLFRWFKDHDSFVMEEDFQDLVLITEDKEREMASILAGLKHLESMELIKKQLVGEREIWLLNKSFAQFEQTVELSADTCSVIAEVLNNFCDLIEDKTDYCDPTAICEKDVRNLLLIYEQTKKIAHENIKDDLT